MRGIKQYHHSSVIPVAFLRLGEQSQQRKLRFKIDTAGVIVCFEFFMGFSNGLQKPLVKVKFSDKA